MNWLMRTIGCGLCLAAVVATLGGHWLALQSVAWCRMVAEFSQTESIGNALRMTFDGKHPCRLCRKVMQGAQRERQDQEKHPWVKADKKPELFFEARRTLLPDAPSTATAARPFVPSLHSEFDQPPPTPPPRRFFAAL
jgi:hypothetical protein